MAKERRERVARLLVVLVRVRAESGGLYLGRATAAARWRPAGALGARGTGRQTPARGVESGGGLGATRGTTQQAGGGLPAGPERRRR